MEETTLFLDYLNIALTSGVLIVLIGAAVKYGQLTEKVDNLSVSHSNLWKSHKELDNKVFTHITKEKH